MEPFRIIVDMVVKEKQFTQFETEEKHIMLTVLQKEIKIAGTTQVLTNAIKIYVKSVFDALNDRSIERIIFYEL